jgi:LysR family cys regulon transcriptional activator
VNFQQLKIIREAARRDYNLTEVANMLYTSQSGVSRHIRELEELGIEIFIRRGKRLLGMTEPGKALLTIAERILNEASNVRRLADLFTNDASGVLTIATTHTQARYSLPPVIKAFRELFPDVRLELIQGTPQEIDVLLQNGGADIGIASERLSNDPPLVVSGGSAGTTVYYFRRSSTSSGFTADAGRDRQRLADYLPAVGTTFALTRPLNRKG